MIRAHLLDGVSVTAAAHGYSRAGFYLVAAAFEQSGMSGLLDDKRGRHGPVKLTAEIVEFLQAAPPARSGAELGSSNSPTCSAAPPTSSTAAATSNNAATPSPRNATSSPATTSCATASATSPPASWP
ncbi:MAG: helix-turn-helix domain-containing protein [Streptosporangiaceae bacterium]|nr:helix-turn-helix domain-containing protein [Streptosporangiaceae bacterium]